jgi:hypothetical protein
MQQIGIRFINIEVENAHSIAKNLQSFIIEGDYSIPFILQQLQNEERIVLDVSNEKNMPEFTVTVEGFDKDEIEYELYKEVNGDWNKTNLEDLDLNRNPQWLIWMIGLALLAYFVVGLIETSAIYNLYTVKHEINSFFAGVGALITAYIPIVGSVVAYDSAIELWHWSWYNALFIFFFYYLPLLGFILYLIWVVLKALYEDKWYQFRHSEFN